MWVTIDDEGCESVCGVFLGILFPPHHTRSVLAAIFESMRSQSVCNAVKEGKASTNVVVDSRREVLRHIRQKSNTEGAEAW